MSWGGGGVDLDSSHVSSEKEPIEKEFGRKNLVNWTNPVSITSKRTSQTILLLPAGLAGTLKLVASCWCEVLTLAACHRSTASRFFPKPVGSKEKKNYREKPSVLLLLFYCENAVKFC